MEDEPEKVVDDLNPTEDGEASEETHCASYQAQLGLHCHLAIITKISMNGHQSSFKNTMNLFSLLNSCLIPSARQAQIFKYLNKVYMLRSYRLCHAEGTRPLRW